MCASYPFVCRDVVWRAVLLCFGLGGGTSINKYFIPGVVKVDPSYTHNAWRTRMSPAVTLMHKFHDHPTDMYVFSVDDRASFTSRQYIRHCWAPEQRSSLKRNDLESKVRQVGMEPWKGLCLGVVKNFRPYKSQQADNDHVQYRANVRKIVTMYKDTCGCVCVCRKYNFYK